MRLFFISCIRINNIKILVAMWLLCSEVNPNITPQWQEKCIQDHLLLG
jgi:hypothetical protein